MTTEERIEKAVNKAAYKSHPLGFADSVSVEWALEEIIEERSRVIDEVKAKGNELAKILRNADPVMFPTLVIRAEAIEDFCKTLTAHGEH